MIRSENIRMDIIFYFVFSDILVQICSGLDHELTFRNTALRRPLLRNTTNPQPVSNAFTSVQDQSDYLHDSEKPKRFYIQSKRTERNATYACFHSLQKQTFKNGSEFEMSGEKNDNIGTTFDNLSEADEKLIKSILCLYDISNVNSKSKFTVGQFRETTNQPKLIFERKKRETFKWDKITGLNYEWGEYIMKTTGLSISKEILLERYLSICPITDYCHMNIRSKRFLSSYKTPVFCRTCTCDLRCVYNGNCCPSSIYGYLPYKCVSTIVYSAHPVLASYQAHYMISKCPSRYRNASDIDEMCSGFGSKLKPVTSNPTLLNYKNHFCAQCHGENNFTNWSISLVCRGNITISYHASHLETKQDLDKNGCMLFYNDISGQPSRCRKITEEDIDTCNVTGLWEHYDENIDWACRNFITRFNHFKNVFCYICNPSVTTKTADQMISSCNITGLWKPRITGNQEVDCKQFGTSNRLLPFANSYCAMCNGLSFRMRQLWKQHSMQFYLRYGKKLYTEVEVMTRISVYKTNYDDTVKYIHDQLKGLFVNEAVLKTPLRADSDVFKVDNMGDFLAEYVAICGRSSICTTSKLESPANKFSFENPLCGHCICQPQCILNASCCVDMYLQYIPYSCYKFQIYYPSLQNDTFFNLKSITNWKVLNTVLIDKCIDQDVPHWLRKKCEQSNETDTLSKISVSAGFKYVYFKNIYCFICNNVNTKYYQLSFYMHYYCDGFVEQWLFPDFQTAYDWITANCVMTLHPGGTKMCPQKYLGKHQGYRFVREHTELSNLPMNYSHVTVYDTCNKTGFWRHGTPFIKEACMNTHTTISQLPDYRIENSLYKNVFCYICNPDVDPDIFSTEVIASCSHNISSNKDYREDLCHLQDYHPRWLPYKNFICKNCNLPPLKKIFILESGFYYPVISVVSYKSMFNIREQVWQQLFEVDSTKAEINDICPLENFSKFNITCTDLKCRTGLKFVNMSCTPILEILINSSFEIRMAIIQADCATDNNLRTRICLLIAQNIRAEMKNTANIDPIACQIFSARDCRETSKVDDVNNDVISFKFLVSTISTVTEFQNKLMAFLLRGLHFRNEEERCAGQLSFYKYTNTYMHSKYCKQYFPLDRSHIKSIVIVDRFFICPYMELNLDKDFVHEKGETVIFGGVHIPRSTYMRNGSIIHLCLHDLLQLLERNPLKVSPLVTRYKYFSNICTGISIICLLFTLLTYSLFPSLRTIPGRNNITLTLALILAQSVYMSQQVIVSISTIPYLCTVLGVACHYFWLASFCAMNVCSFHMYRLFSLKRWYLLGLEKNILIQYRIYVFSFPLVLVSATFAVNAVLSDNTYFGYGTITCFLSDVYSLIVSFIIPASLIFLSNFIFFSIAFYNIKTSQSRVRNTGSRNRRDFVVYFRLCTIVGVTWPLLVADGFLDISWFSFVASGMNALQGVFIFVSYVCNRRVFNLFTSMRRQSMSGGSFLQSRTRQTQELSDLSTRVVQLK